MFRPTLSVLLLAGAAGISAPAAAQDAAASFTAAPLAADIPSELPRSARPLRYVIEIAPDAANMAFAGRSSVEIEIYEQIDQLLLQAVDLAIGDAVLVPLAGGVGLRMDVSYDPAAQTVAFASGAPIVPGRYRLDTAYTGKIETQSFGLFALDAPDRESGETKRSLFTQFEIPDARRIAPMFDEPAYKARFDLSAVVPAKQMAVSNMPMASEEALANGRKRVTFATTPPMSSYLLFFGLGDFERRSTVSTGGIEVGIVAATGSGNQADYALEALGPLVDWYGDYFGVDYPLPKLDNVAASGESQSFGAMENWGAILTFDQYLLNDPSLSTAADLEQIYIFQAHEVAHQWFGNLVTMAWWGDLWLNEGFASWMENKAADHFHPEWQRLLTRVDDREYAMALDALSSTHPIIQNVTTLTEAAQAFDDISYAKGSAVLAMLESHTGEDAWRDGMRRYFAAHAYGNTQSRDLWAALEAAGATDVTTIAKDFTTQPGVPLVLAADQCIDGQTRLSLTQSEFSLDRREDEDFTPLRWHVPLGISVAGSAPVHAVLDGTAELTLPGCGPVIVNSGQLGYFRTLYEDDMADGHVASFAGLSPIDQLGLLKDAMALSEAGYRPAAYGLDLLAAVPADASQRVAAAAIDLWSDTWGVAEGRTRRRIARLARDAWLPRLDTLGYEARPGESALDAQLRADLIAGLGAMNDENILAEAQRRLRLLARDPRALDGPMKATWLDIAAVHATKADWDLLLRLARESANPIERATYFRLLGDANDARLVARALTLALTGEMGTTSASVIQHVGSRHALMAFDYVLAHLERVRALSDATGWQSYVPDLVESSNDPAMETKLIAYRDILPQDEKRPISAAIEALQVRLAAQPVRRAGIAGWIANR